MDRKAWIVVTLTGALMVAWVVYQTKTLPARLAARRAAAVAAAQAQAQAQAQAAAQRAAATPAAAAAPAPALVTAGAGSVPAPAAPAPAVPVTAARPEQIETVTLPQAVIRFTSAGGGIADLSLLGKQHLDPHHEPIRLNRHGGVPIGALALGDQIGQADVRESYTVRREGDSTVVFERVTPEQVRVTKRFTVQPARNGEEIPTVTLAVSFRNVGAQPVRLAGYSLFTGSAEPIRPRDQPIYTEFAWLRQGSLVDKGVNYFDPSKVPLLGIQTSAGHAFFQQPLDKLAWLGVKNQFYTTILTPEAGSGGGADGGPPPDTEVRGVWAQRFVVPSASDDPPPAPNQPPVYGVEAALEMPGLDLAPAQELTRSFQVYAGPTYYQRLAQLGHSQQELLKYGTFTKLVSVFLLNTMNWLEARLGNYALAIVVLTLLLKLILLYPQLRANDTQRRMAALGPKMTELREKYKEDPARMQQETMKLYKEYNVSPVGGCLPILIQMPIFIGFFKMLSSAAELRNAGFLWVHDLSQPDTVGHLLGYPINILPLLWAGTMVWQTSLMPKTGDPAQQRLMGFVPLIFVFICYNFASALALYYTMQTVLSIAQVYFTRNRPLPKLEKTSAPGGKNRGGRSSGPFRPGGGGGGGGGATPTGGPKRVGTTTFAPGGGRGKNGSRRLRT